MKEFKFYDRIAGWIAFAVAAVCYLLTIEPTASWWDCGEFIATAIKLEVGHPPGAPLWMIIGRVAALLAPDDAHMALMMNATSALAAAFTSLFLFWSVTHIARRVIENSYYSGQRVKQYSLSQTIVILGSGMVGALIYTFCDTAWFSAVEAEVYSMSSLFTAVVFWLILKWEEQADEKYSNRWLILICYLMGLSIGVHLLNLLVIPAIVLIVYYRKFQHSTKGTILALIISVVILAVILYFIIPQTVNIAAHFDLFFVNVLGLPYYSGIITFLLIVMTGLGYLVWYSHKKNKVLLNLCSLGVFAIMIGYGSFAMTVIRSFANPPINENSPSDGFSLLSYLNREQYGDNPLFYGPYFTAEVVKSEKETTYIPVDGRYMEVYKPSPKYYYDSENQGFFPRMYSTNSGHVQVYKSWAGLDDTETRPSFAQNMRFFFTYQLGHMYFRYFMWNFVGRQNDIQNGAGNVINGNWISGIDFIDGLKGASSVDLPDRYKNNPGRNVYFFLPLILGLLGIYITMSKDSKNNFVVFMFFILTGVAIVVYLNQTPYQPRERDYAYAGSFYAFSIWCGLGVLALWEMLKKLFGDNKELVAAALSTIAIAVPIEMAYQNWDDHDRSGRYTARDFAVDYLESCAPNAILFTFGDNDTFPLWYAQEVEGVRRDVRIVNLSLAGCDWYLKQCQEKKYEGLPVKMTLSPAQYRADKRNIVICTEQGRAASGQYNTHKAEIDSVYVPLYKDFMAVIDASDFPTKYVKDYQTISVGTDKMNPLTFASIVKQLTKPEIVKMLFPNSAAVLDNIKSRTDKLIDKLSAFYTPISDVMKVVGNDSELVKMQNGESYNYIPSKTVSVPVNIENCIACGTLDDRNKNRALKELKWDISKSYFTKSDLAVMDIICANNWERPVYFAVSGSSSDFLGLDKYMRLEGFAYRLVPYDTSDADPGEIGEVDSKIMYDNMMHKMVWGRMNEPDVVIEENNHRQISIMDIRDKFARLAEQLVKDGEKEKAQEVIKKVVELTPNDKLPYDYSMLPVVSALYSCGLTAEAEKISVEMTNDYQKIIVWLQNLQKDGFSENREYGMSVSVLGYLGREAMINGATQTAEYIDKVYSSILGVGIEESLK
ncbi:MAG: DUF2723 domain-containing protein [Bacteroidales bacterium]|nr:DUF2723 domain-containing protein [Bacteroidales bacterium]